MPGWIIPCQLQLPQMTSMPVVTPAARQRGQLIRSGAPGRNFESQFGLFSRDPMMSMFLALLGSLSGIAAHRNIVKPGWRKHLGYREPVIPPPLARRRSSFKSGPSSFRATWLRELLDEVLHTESFGGSGEINRARLKTVRPSNSI